MTPNQALLTAALTMSPSTIRQRTKQQNTEQTLIFCIKLDKMVFPLILKKANVSQIRCQMIFAKEETNSCNVLQLLLLVGIFTIRWHLI